MRWFETIALIWIGALIGGAYFLSADSTAITLSQQGVDGSFHDTYFVIAHQAYVRRLMFVIIVAALVYLAIVRLGTPRLRLVAAPTVILWCVGITLAAFPQHLLGRLGMPRRYIDYPDAFATWHAMSNVGSSVMLLCSVLLLGLLFAAIYMSLRFRRR